MREKLDAGLSPRTVQYLRFVLRKALDQAVIDNLIPRNPVAGVKSPQVRREEIKPLSPEQARRFPQLSPDHPRGRHKARVFASVLGLTADDAEEVRQALLAAAISEDAASTENNEYGKRYVLDFEMRPRLERRRSAADG